MKKEILALIMGCLFIGANVYAAGDLQVNGSLGVGATPSSSAKQITSGANMTGLSVQSSVTDPATTALEAANLLVSIEGTADGGSYRGNTNRALHKGNNANLTLMNGGDDMVQYNSTISGTTNIISSAALNARISNSGNFARNYNFLYGLFGINIQYSFDPTSGGGTITTPRLTGIQVAAPSGSHISATNLSGIWIEKQTKGTNNYGVVLNGDGAGSDIVFGPTQQAKIYSTSGELFAKDSAGNVTQISPHDTETGEWIFYSKNIKTGKTVRVNMEKLVKAVEKLTGEKFMVESIVEQ